MTDTEGVTDAVLVTVGVNVTDGVTDTLGVVVGVSKLSGHVLSTRGPECTYRWCICYAARCNAE